MLTLKQVTDKDRELLWNMNQKYLYEMTNFYPDDMDENGNYHYGYFEAYFTDPERKAWFICDDDTYVGFAMVNPYGYTDEKTDNVMAEFTVFPSYRRKGYAEKAARMVIGMRPGRWQIKFNEKNTAAKHLWETLTAAYHPAVCHLNDEETVLAFYTGPGER